MPQAGEGIGEAAVAASGVSRRVAGDDGKFEVLREIDEMAVEASVVPEALPDEFDMEVFAAELIDQVLCGGEGGGFVVCEEVSGNGAVAVSC
jgi:ketol-acid reductoisomerase